MKSDRSVLSLPVRASNELTYWLWNKFRAPLLLHPTDDGTLPCVDRFPDDDLPWSCTRDIGHSGSHMAGTHAAVVAIWDDQWYWSVQTGWVVR